MIRIDCYLWLLKDCKRKNPNAHFEVITNPTKHPLSPSDNLLIEAGIFKRKDGKYNPKMPFKIYRKKFIKEMLSNPKAIKKIQELKKMHENGETIFLVCYEKDPKKCHRSIVKELIEKINISN